MRDKFLYTDESLRSLLMSSRYRFDQMEIAGSLGDLGTGALLMAQGVKFMIGSSKFQMVRHMVEPYLTLQHVGPISIGIIIGIIGGVLMLLFLENRKFPAGLVIILGESRWPQIWQRGL